MEEDEVLASVRFGPGACLEVVHTPREYVRINMKGPYLSAPDTVPAELRELAEGLIKEAARLEAEKTILTTTDDEIVVSKSGIRGVCIEDTGDAHVVIVRIADVEKLVEKIREVAAAAAA